MNYEGLYEVSNLGNVRSLARMTPSRWGNMKLSPGGLLSPEVHRLGYKRVHLSKKSVRTKFLVHRLVATAFVKPNGKPHINHIDSDRGNNRVDNLEWVTPKENSEHAVRAGRTKREFCKYGHRLEGNIYMPPNGQRRCLTCHKATYKKYNAGYKLRAEQRLRKDAL